MLPRLYCGTTEENEGKYCYERITILLYRLYVTGSVVHVCVVHVCGIVLRPERELWLIFVIEQREKGNDGRKDTVQVRILKSKDIEMWQSLNFFRNILVSTS